MLQLGVAREESIFSDLARKEKRRSEEGEKEEQEKGQIFKLHFRTNIETSF